MRINEIHNSFLNYGRGERNYARETLVKLADCFRAWILPVLGEIEIENLTRLDIIRLRNAMVGRGIGISRQYSVLMAMKVFCKFCRQILHLSCLDPDKEIQLPKKPVPFVHYLSNEEVERLRNCIDIHKFAGLRMRTLIEVLLTTGLRISEALSLNRAPFELGSVEVDVVGKGGKKRTIFFPEATIGWIRRFLRYRGDDFLAVFVTTGIPRRWDRNDLSKYFKATTARTSPSSRSSPDTRTFKRPRSIISALASRLYGTRCVRISTMTFREDHRRRSAASRPK